MTILIEFYILLCGALLAFDLIFVVVKSRRANALYPKNDRFEQDLRQVLERYDREGVFSFPFQQTLHKKLTSVRNLITLVSVMEEKNSWKHLLAPWIFGLVREYSKKNLQEQAYYTYVISLLDYPQTQLPEEFVPPFLTFLDSSSLYTFSNTMTALYACGRSDLMLIALNKVDERGGFYHKKLLVDGLLGSRLNFDEFSPQVLKRFPHYSPYLQDCLLDFFRMSNFDAKDLCLELIQEKDIDAEVRCSAMRYLGKFPCPASNAIFLDLLESPNQDWVAQMLAIQALGRDRDPRVREAIKGKLSSRDWYVRVNAAQYLYRSHLTLSEVWELLSRRDRYSTEILRYCCREDEALTACIDEILLQFQAEDQAKAAESQQKAAENQGNPAEKEAPHAGSSV